MKRICFLSAACMFPGHPQFREDHWEHDLEFAPMQKACATRGIDLQVAIWDDPGLDSEAYDAFLIGTTWDYAEKPQEFLATLELLASAKPLFNPLPIVRWNMDKKYLNDLSAKGAPVVPTLWRDRADAATIAASFDELETDEIVVKPVVGASAWRQARLSRGQPLPPAEDLPPTETMIQPFLPATLSEGEYSFIFFDGVFSHCARKIPRDGDYRVQSMYGGYERVHQPSDADMELAKRVLDAVDTPLLYSRVDMMRDGAEQLVVMELELIEPYLYPEQGPGMGETFAAALERMLPS